MRLRAKYVLMGWLCISVSANAQDQMEKLTIPSSPAFSILDFEPTSVMHPTSNKDLAADILNAFDKNGKLIANLGLEVSPYWLQSRPKLSYDKYIKPDLGQAFVQSFSISAATVKDSASGMNKLGTGVRFKLWNGQPVDELTVAQKAYQDETTILSKIAGARGAIGGAVKSKRDAIDFIVNALDASIDKKNIEKFKNQALETAKGYSDSEGDIKTFLEKLISDRTDANGDLYKKVATLIKQRKGFVLEVAGASSFITSKNNDLDKAGVWLNASYYVSESDLFTTTIRGMFRNGDTSINNFDAGVSYLKKADKFNISLEAMARWYSAQIPDINQSGEHIKRTESNFTYRVAFQGAYIISNDLSINLSIGKNFDSPFFSSTSFFSIMGLNYSIFNKERVELPKFQPQ